MSCSMSNQPLLRIHDLAVGYGDQVVVRGINLDISPRDYIGVIGPNGGGKSTLIKTLIGTLPPLGGAVTRRAGLKIGYLPQTKSLDSTFPITVSELVLSGLLSRSNLWGNYTRQERAEARRWMERTGILPLGSKSIARLSGGELQRALLCRALVSQPELLVLDEPATFVDPVFEQELYKLLAELNQTIAIVMVSHDLGVIGRHVKSVACINGCFHYHPSVVPPAGAASDGFVQLLSHGEVPYTILSRHDSEAGGCGCGSSQVSSEDSSGTDIHFQYPAK